MNKLFGRTIPVLLRSHKLSRKLGPLHPLDTDKTSFRVLPHDLDLNLHLNNGRYLQLADLGRLSWLLRTGIAGMAMRERMKAVLGGTSIQFRRELRLWERGEVHSRLLGWDDRWFYLEHQFTTTEGRPVATALARAAFRKAGRWVHPASVQAALGSNIPAPLLPASVDSWKHLDAALDTRLQIARITRTDTADAG